MERIIDYAIALGHTSDLLVEVVRGYIQRGWQPLGAPLVGRDDRFYQAMVLYESRPLRSVVDLRALDKAGAK